MRKMLTLVLALSVVLSLCIPTLAAETDVSTGAYSTDVTGTYVEGTTASGTVFSVDIAWEGMSFTYHAEKAPVWDATNHKYSETTPAKWEGEGTITVTNHSNAKITATPEYVAESAFSATTMKFNTDVLKIASAETGSAQTGTITVTPEGTLAATANGTKIGTLKVTIAEDANVTVEEATALRDRIVEFYEQADTTGAVDAHREEFTAMVDLLTELETHYQNSGSGDAWQAELNRLYAETLAAYNVCVSLV